MNGADWKTPIPGVARYRVTVIVTEVNAQSAEAACNKVRDVIELAERGHELGPYDYTVQKAERE